jgi:LCP family protein required for cell wall assembly
LIVGGFSYIIGFRGDDLKFLGAIFAWMSANVLAIKRFFVVAGSATGFALFLTVGITAALLAFEDTGLPPSMLESGSANIVDGENSDYLAITIDRPEDGDDGSLLRPPARTNFLMVGLDNQLLADAIMVGTFYRDSGNIHLMSVPRDMFVRLPQHRLDRMREAGFHPPTTLKINELRAHGGRLHGIYFLQEQLEEMFGVEFDFYIEVEIPAFRRIVDAIGGVYMDIPRRLFYNGWDQNPPILIDIPAGQNVRLDGNMAEGVVRYRQWRMGDLDRNNMQMQFMTNLFQQMLTREAIMNDPMAIINIVLTEVRSNIGMSAVRYIPFIPRMSAGSLQSFVMPGDISMVGNREFWIPNASQLPAVITNVFYATPDVPAEFAYEVE